MTTPIRAHVLYEGGSEDHAGLLERLHPAVSVTWGREIPDPSGVTILIGGSADHATLIGCPRLRAFIVPWAGPPVALRALLGEFPHITLHNLHHNAAATAESAMALLLAAAKRTVQRDRDFRRDGWPARENWDREAMELEGRTALILGLGAIGSRIARACLALDMTVLATRRTQRTVAVENGVEVHPVGSMPLLLTRAHVLINCLPGTPGTAGLIGATELASLASPSVVVNVGRGATFDEQALFDALRNGTVHAAGIDVWWHYMPGAEEDNEDGLRRGSALPFHELDKLVMTPHRGGMTRDAERKRMAHLAVLLNAAARGEQIPNRVPLDRGY